MNDFLLQILQQLFAENKSEINDYVVGKDPEFTQHKIINLAGLSAVNKYVASHGVTISEYVAMEAGRLCTTPTQVVLDLMTTFNVSAPDLMTLLGTAITKSVSSVEKITDDMTLERKAEIENINLQHDKMKTGICSMALILAKEQMIELLKAKMFAKASDTEKGVLQIFFQQLASRLQEA